MNVFATTERHMSWLGSRQALASVNVANSDTPGFKAREISPFGEVLQTSSVRLARSDPAHFDSSRGVPTRYESRMQNNEEANLSGNDVVLEKEMRTIGENARMFSFDLTLIKSFHRMLLASVKG